MKSLTQYICEYRTTDEIKVYKDNMPVLPIRYIYDEESFNNFIEDYKKDDFDKDNIYLCKLKGNKWNIINHPCEFDLTKINNEFLKVDKQTFTKDELLVDLENSEYIIVILQNK